MNKKFNFVAWILPFAITAIALFAAQSCGVRLGALWVVGIFLGSSAIVSAVMVANKQPSKSSKPKNGKTKDKAKADETPKKEKTDKKPKKLSNGVWICPECQTPNVDKAKSCYNCGAAFDK